MHDGKVLVYVAEADLCHSNKIISLLTAFVYDMESIKMLLTLLAEFYFIYDESKALGGCRKDERKKEERMREEGRGESIGGEHGGRGILSSCSDGGGCAEWRCDSDTGGPRQAGSLEPASFGP